MTDARTPPASWPRAAASGLVFVERRLLRLSDPEAPALRRAHLPSEEAPVTTGAGPDLALFHSVLDDGAAHADLELWEHPVPAPPHPWDLTAVHEVEVVGPHIAVVSGISSLGRDCVLPVPADTYILEVHCRGRAAAEAAFLAWLDAEEEEVSEGAEPTTAPHHDGIERWLVRLWPTRSATA